jgi:hypothetical protein
VEISFVAKGDIEIKRRVMADGRYEKVKSPKWLKDEIAREVRVMRV